MSIKILHSSYQPLCIISSVLKLDHLNPWLSLKGELQQNYWHTAAPAQVISEPSSLFSHSFLDLSLSISLLPLIASCLYKPLAFFKRNQWNEWKWNAMSYILHMSTDRMQQCCVADSVCIATKACLTHGSTDMTWRPAAWSVHSHNSVMSPHTNCQSPKWLWISVHNHLEQSQPLRAILSSLVSDMRMIIRLLPATTTAMDRPTRFEMD